MIERGYIATLIPSNRQGCNRHSSTNGRGLTAFGGAKGRRPQPRRLESSRSVGTEGLIPDLEGRGQPVRFVPPSDFPPRFEPRLAFLFPSDAVACLAGAQRARQLDRDCQETSLAAVNDLAVALGGLHRHAAHGAGFRGRRVLYPLHVLHIGHDGPAINSGSIRSARRLTPRRQGCGRTARTCNRRWARAIPPSSTARRSA